MTAPADEFTELVDADIPRVDLVDKAANGMRFLIAKSGAGLISAADVRDLLAKADMSAADVNDLPDDAFAYIEPGGSKDEGGKTTPRSLRHFPINDEAHIRNALARAPQSPFGDKALPKIRAAARAHGIEVSKMADETVEDGAATLDVTEPLAEVDADPMATVPGSPAWEAVDAATARKWTSILARAKNALGVMADRERIESAVADEDDLWQAIDLDDAACALDYVIGTLATFAATEQAEADMAEDMAAVGKALAGFDPTSLETIEAFGQVRKAGRVLSTANEAAIRGAVESLQKVLASLPQAPAADDSGQEVAKSEETTMDAAEVEKTTDEPVTKADGEESEAPKVVAVYDARGKLVGVVNEGAITCVEQPGDADADGDEDMGGEPDGDEAATDAPGTADLTPAPAGEVGTPADDVAKTTTNDTSTTEDVLKGIAVDVTKQAIDAHAAAQQEVIAKQAETIAALTDAVGVLKGRVEALEEQPAAPRVFTNGAVPPTQLRGQDRGPAAVAVDAAHAAELRKGLYANTAGERDSAAQAMNEVAYAKWIELTGRNSY